MRLALLGTWTRSSRRAPPLAAFPALPVFCWTERALASSSLRSQAACTSKPALVAAAGSRYAAVAAIVRANRSRAAAVCSGVALDVSGRFGTSVWSWAVVPTASVASAAWLWPEAVPASAWSCPGAAIAVPLATRATAATAPVTRAARLGVVVRRHGAGTSPAAATTAAAAPSSSRTPHTVSATPTGSATPDSGPNGRPLVRDTAQSATRATDPAAPASRARREEGRAHSHSAHPSWATAVTRKNRPAAHHSWKWSALTPTWMSAAPALSRAAHRMRRVLVSMVEGCPTEVCAE